MFLPFKKQRYYKYCVYNPVSKKISIAFNSNVNPIPYYFTSINISYDNIDNSQVLIFNVDSPVHEFYLSRDSVMNTPKRIQVNIMMATSRIARSYLLESYELYISEKDLKSTEPLKFQLLLR